MEVVWFVVVVVFFVRGGIFYAMRCDALGGCWGDMQTVHAHEPCVVVVRVVESIDRVDWMNADTLRVEILLSIVELRSNEEY